VIIFKRVVGIDHKLECIACIIGHEVAAEHRVIINTEHASAEKLEAPDKVGGRASRDVVAAAETDVSSV